MLVANQVQVMLLQIITCHAIVYDTFDIYDIYDMVPHLI